MASNFNLKKKVSEAASILTGSSVYTGSLHYYAPTFIVMMNLQEDIM